MKKVIKKVLLETYLKENIDLNQAVRMNTQFSEKFKLDKLYPELGEILGTDSPPNSPSFAQAIFRYQARFMELSDEDGIIGPATFNHILKNNPSLNKKAGKPTVPIAGKKVNVPQSKPFNINDFKQSIADIESYGGRYDARNQTTSAVGKYQMLWKMWGKEIQEFAGKEITVDQYLNNPKLQERFMDHYIKNVLQKEASKLASRYPKAKEKYNTNQLMALLHFKGWNGARDWVLNGEDKTAANNKSIDDYLSKF